MGKEFRPRKMSEKWGTDKLNCAHPKIIQRNGLVYCTKCGKNFHPGDLADDEYYNMFGNEEL